MLVERRVLYVLLFLGVEAELSFQSGFHYLGWDFTKNINEGYQLEMSGTNFNSLLGRLKVHPDLLNSFLHLRLELMHMGYKYEFF